MKSVIVADTGPLIALAKSQQLALLPLLFTAIHIPRTVHLEATHRMMEREDARLIAEFSVRHANIQADIHNPFSQSLASILDEGEIQALALARQLACGVLMDERRGRRVAHHYQIPVIGTLGVLLQAKKQGQLAAIRPLLENLQVSGYRFSPELVEYVLANAGE